jgi:dinuclear metal center YbgI/SA1388 family protein
MATTAPTVHDLLDLLDRLAPFDLAESWDNPGLQVGDLSQVITRICVALDPSVESLRGCSRRAGQLLLTHHPLIFKPLTSLDIRIYPANVVLEAVKADISIIAVHTNLDVARMGINQMLADQLELQEVRVLNEIDAKEGWGLGRIGSLPVGVPLSSFIQKAKTILGTDRLRLTGDPDKEIRQVAVVGGAGGSLIRNAFDKGADLLLTGDVGHHDALEAKTLGLAVIDGGHFLTEQLGLKKFTRFFQETIKEHDWDVDIVFLEDEVDPLYWV